MGSKGFASNASILLLLLGLDPGLGIFILHESANQLMHLVRVSLVHNPYQRGTLNRQLSEVPFFLVNGIRHFEQSSGDNQHYRIAVYEDGLKIQVDDVGHGRIDSLSF
jgi:hypothetical protein